VGEHVEEVPALSKKDLEALSDLLGAYRMVMDIMADQPISEFSKIATTLFKLLNGLVSTDLVDVPDPGLDKALAGRLGRSPP